MTTTATIISNLQAEVEQLRIALSAMVDQRDDLQLTVVNLRQQIAHLSDGIAGLKSDVNLAKKQRDELLDVFSMVIDEMEHRDRCDGNAPGHGHKTPGIWDSDNGKLAGAPCAWCAVWSKAKELSASIASAKGGAE